jgi:hypothetical protein
VGQHRRVDPTRDRHQQPTALQLKVFERVVQRPQ